MTEKFRTNTIPLAGTVDGDVILGVRVATTGEAQGHRLEFDRTSLDQLQKLQVPEASLGIKSRFTHPDWFHDGLGKYLGRVRRFSGGTDDKLIRRPPHQPQLQSSPAGNLAEYVLSLATEDPGSFGVSVVVDLDRVWVTTDGHEVSAAEGRPANATGKYPVARITAFYAADLVDEPALNPEGLIYRGTERLEPRGIIYRVGT